MGELVQFDRTVRATLGEHIARQSKVPRIAIDLQALVNGRFEVTLRRADGLRPLCTGTYPDHAGAWRAAWLLSERLGLPLNDQTATADQ